MPDDIHGGAADASLAVSLHDLRRVTEVGLTEIKGELRLLVQRADQVDRRAEDISKELDRLTERVSDVEGRTVTKRGVYTIVGLLLGAVSAMVPVALYLASRGV